jgi:hypothetical protein
MNAHIRLVSPEGASDDADIHTNENTEGHDEAPIALPEESVASRNDLLGDKPPLVAEREDRPVGGRSGKAESNKGFAKLLAFAWPPEMKPPSPGADEESEVERNNGASEVADASPKTPAAEDDSVVAEKDEESDTTEGAPAPNAKLPFLKRKSTLLVALAASVAIPAIVVLNRPRNAPPPIVEPGMLADGPTKLMTPSAALATTPPREAPNVAGDRPIVHETRRDELFEMLSFKGVEPAAASASPPASPSVDSIAPPSRSALLSAPGETVKAVGPAKAAAAAEARATESLPPEPLAHAVAASTAPDAKPQAPIEQAKLTAPAAQSPAPQLTESGEAHPANAPAVPAAAAPQEPGLGDAAKIEALTDLETALKDHTSEARARLEAEKAETQLLEKITQLGALVTRLTGQVKDLQDQVRTLSTGSEEKFADLTRRVALGEANRAVAGAENASASGPSPSTEAHGPKTMPEGQDRVQTKVVDAGAKHNYRIQAASPGLAMLSVIDGGSDDRPVEVAIGAEIPGYGKVLSIEQHGEAWVVKADRGSIQ